MRMLQLDGANQFASGYTGMGNNPVMGVDPDGQWVHIVIGAAVGGVVNLGIKAWQGKIDSWGDGFMAFGIGAAAGAVTAATGGAASVFASTGSFAGAFSATAVAVSTTGVIGGAVAGAAGSATGGLIQGIGNAAYFGDPYSAKDWAMGIGFGALTGGISGGIAARLQRNHIFNGTPDGKGFAPNWGKEWVKTKDGWKLSGFKINEASWQFPNWTDPNGITHQGGSYSTNTSTIASNSNLNGTFSVIDWSTYPTVGNIPRPIGPFRILEGQEYIDARKLANSTNELLKRQGVFPRGTDIHEIHPVKFGGSPTDLSNKVALPRNIHSQYTTWWNNLQRHLKR